MRNWYFLITSWFNCYHLFHSERNQNSNQLCDTCELWWIQHAWSKIFEGKFKTITRAVTVSKLYPMWREFSRRKWHLEETGHWPCCLCKLSFFWSVSADRTTFFRREPSYQPRASQLARERCPLCCQEKTTISSAWVLLAVCKSFVCWLLCLFVCLCVVSLLLRVFLYIGRDVCWVYTEIRQTDGFDGNTRG